MKTHKHFRIGWSCYLWMALTIFMATISSQAQTNYATQVLVTSNLLGYWPFSPASQANSSFGTNTGTFSGNAQVGPVGSGPMFLNTPTNTAVLLDGNGDFVTTTLVGGLNTTGSNANQASIIGWFKLAVLPSSAGRTFYVAGESQVGNDVDLQIEPDNKIKFYTDSGSSTVDTNVFTVADINIWHFFAATFSNNVSRKIYMDGVLAASSTPGNHNPAGSGIFAIGESHVFTGRFFQGAIDDVAIFNRELTATEIANLYIAAGYHPASGFIPACTNLTVTLSAGSTNCTVTTNSLVITNGLVSFWRANGDANDSFGTNNGTLQNGASFSAGQDGQAFDIQPSQNVNVGDMKDLAAATGITISGWLKIVPTTNGQFYLFSQAVGVGLFPFPSGLNCVGAPGAQAGSMSLSARTNQGVNSVVWSLPFVMTNYSQACPDSSVQATNVTFQSMQSIGALPPNQWIHLAATWRSSDGLTIIYTNGVQAASTNFGAGASIPPLVSNPENLSPGTTGRTGAALIGAGSFAVSGFSSPIIVPSSANGEVDNLRIYSRALTSAEIQQIMTADSSTPVLTTNCVTGDAVTTNLDFCTVAPGKLQIQNLAPGSVQLTWPSKTNAYYLLQASDELSPVNWTNFSGALGGNNSTLLVPDATSARPRRFYRLLSTEP